VIKQKARPFKVSIVCPVYNEASVIESSICGLKRCVSSLPYSCEVLLINDGSTDATVDKAISAIDGDPRFRILSHRVNFGRGRALRTGFMEAKGEYIATTEGDLSWGYDIVGRMIEALENNPRLDAIFASPHLPGGGYQNVPWHRVFLSKLGNHVLRFLYTGNLSMTTGMTRAYRASVIQSYAFTHDGKELHLEISHRLLSLGHRIGEIPAVLNWPSPTTATASRSKRTNWGKIFKLISSHMAFGFFRGVSHIIGPSIFVLSLAITFFGGWAVWNFLKGSPSIYLVTLTGILIILWLTLVTSYVILRQTLQIEREQWQTQGILGSYLRDVGHFGGASQYYDEIEISAKMQPVVLAKPSTKAGNI
jgi:glycosyltransferase involved in cell wall biosynthesis